MSTTTEDPRPLLSDHDKRVLALLGAGYDRREIGLALGISKRTVQYHLEKLLVKFAAANVRELLGRFIPPDVFTPPVISASSARPGPSRRVTAWH